VHRSGRGPGIVTRRHLELDAFSIRLLGYVALPCTADQMPFVRIVGGHVRPARFTGRVVALHHGAELIDERCAGRVRLERIVKDGRSPPARMKR
jgi:hypothetical protein